MAIVFTRWHWVCFIVLWLVELNGWWVMLTRAPAGSAVLHFLRGTGWHGWYFGGVTVVGCTAGPAFLTVAIWSKLLEVFSRRSWFTHRLSGL